MLFDLEIQPNLVDVVYIKENNDIHSSLIPISYVGIAERNIVPSDIIEIEEGSRFTSFATSYIGEATGSMQFPMDTDKFLMTHVKKYNNDTGTDVPLFFRHTIDISQGAVISGDSIRIYDMNNIAVGEDKFSIEFFENSLLVFLNPIENNILRIEYTLNNGIISELVKLEPVFKKVEWDWVVQADQLKMFEYLYFDGIVYTQYVGSKYFMSQKDVSIFNKPIAGMNESWYLRIENINFSINNGTQLVNYSIPEFNTQQLVNNLTTKYYKKIQAKIIGTKYVQLQDSISREYKNSVDIYIRNINQDGYEFIFTGDPNKQNTIDSIDTGGTGLRWIAITDWNTDGIFELPVTLTQDHVAYSNFVTPNTYYEFRILDLNALDVNASKALAIYIVPTDVSSGSMTSIYYSYIGLHDTRSVNDKLESNGTGFDDKESYLQALDSNDFIHLAYVSLSSSKMLNITKFYDARDFNGGILNKDVVSKENCDLFISDILNNNIVLPISNSVVTSIDKSVFAKAKNSKDNPLTIADKNSKYIEFVKDVMSKNLDVSTDIIIKNLGE